MAETFEARDSSLGSLFIEYYDSIFQIPDFQRRFVWGKDEFSDFLESIIRNPAGYFIGTIVFTPESSTGTDDIRHDSISIIDGQQRLVTLFITMAALRDMLEDEVQNAAEKHKMHDDIQDAIADLRKWLLVRSGDDKTVKLEFFEDTMNRFFKAITEKHTSIEVLEQIEVYADRSLEEASEKILNKKVARQFVDAYKIIRNIINENVTSAKDMCEVVDKIRDLQIIRFKCNRYELVHSLFEGLNSKGIKLTRSEQIKNILYDHIETLTKHQKNTSSKELKDKWGDLEYLFDTHDVSKNLFDKFLRHYWVANYNRVYMPQLYEVYKKLISELKSPVKLGDFLDELNNAARFYIAIKEESLNSNDFGYLTDPKLIELLNSFGLLDNDQILAVLLLYRKIIIERLASKGLIKKWLEDFWIITFRLKFVSVSPSDFEKELVKYLLSIRKLIEARSSIAEHEMDLATKAAILDKLWRLVDNTESLVQNLADKLSYSQNNKPVIRKVLYDLFVSTNKNIEVKDPSIEHILPQKPIKWGFSGNQVKELVNMFGNLTLLNSDDNRDAGNETFEKKLKLVYDLSHFNINKHISQYTGFDSKNLLDLEAVIQQRGQDMAESLEKIYRVRGR